MNDDVENALRQLPAVGRLLHDDEVQRWLAEHPESLVTEALRRAVDEHRDRIQSGRSGSGDDLRHSVLEAARGYVLEQARPSLVPVINATGIVLHTGLGRAPLGAAALEAIRTGAGGYCNLEMDLTAGKRGRRVDHVNGLLCRLTGAEAATVVNNNAAATLLVLDAVKRLPRGDDSGTTKRDRSRNVIVSRGQLIEIGGSYRLPEIMRASGVQLSEVGTTNRTRISDYEQAIDDRTAAIMRVHTSNYRVTGFSQEVPIEELVELGRRRGVPVIDDLGSGAMVDLAPIGLADEPLVRRSVDSGADLVCFSGDKLLGGPQAGIILGSRRYISAIEKSPLMRTYRVDKLVLLALEATLRCYFDEDRARRDIPALAMLFEPTESIRRRADALQRAVLSRDPQAAVEIVEAVSYAGGGTLPAEQLTTWAVSWRPRAETVDAAVRRLRASEPPIIARVHKDAILFDCRTLTANQLDTIADHLTHSQ